MKKIIAHRGIHNDKIKENTYLSISMAFNNNSIEGIECDLRLTKDNYVVIIHDSYIDRTSNGHGKVENMTLKELKKYNYGSKNLYQSIPTLDKILDINTNKLFLLEVKVDNNIKRFSKSLTTILKKYEDKNIYITSFSKKFLLYLLKNNPNLNIGPIILNNNISNNKYNFFILNYLTVNINTIKKLAHSNKKVFIWGITNDDVHKFKDLETDIYLLKDIKK